MTTMETSSTEGGTGVEEEVRYLSPPEYVKYANARDRRRRHEVDLAHFITYFREKVPPTDREIPNDLIDQVISDYLDETGVS